MAAAAAVIAAVIAVAVEETAADSAAVCRGDSAAAHRVDLVVLVVDLQAVDLVVRKQQRVQAAAAVVEQVLAVLEETVVKVELDH